MNNSNPNSINVIIFSKDRAMQLDALLQTIKKYTPFVDLNVIYTYSSEEFYKGYETLKKDYPNVNFQKESIFKNDILNILNGAASKYMCFFSDDDLFFGKMKFPINLSGSGSFELPDDVMCFSSRLGENCVYCFNFNKKQQYKGEIVGDYLSWNWTEGEWDFGYPMSIDGHIFRTGDIKNLLSSIEFKDPFQLENNLTIEIRRNLNQVGGDG
jgi:hypothetical protein